MVVTVSSSDSKMWLDIFMPRLTPDPLEDPFSAEPFSSDVNAPNAPIVLECGHNFTRETISDVRTPNAVLACTLHLEHVECKHRSDGHIELQTLTVSIKF